MLKVFIYASAVIAILSFILYLLAKSDEKEDKQAYYWLRNFETEVKGIRKTDVYAFINRCNAIQHRCNHDFYKNFQVKESIHGKGWMVEAEHLNSKIYWPSYSDYGNEYYPEHYLETEAEAQEEMLNVMEELCYIVYYSKKKQWDLDSKREDIVK